MFSKLAALFSSIRFWQITLAAITEIAAHFTNGPNSIYHIVSVWLAAVAAIGTIDGAAKNFGANTTTIKGVIHETYIAPAGSAVAPSTRVR